MSKVKIYTWADKSPEFLYKQYETIKKFVKDDDWEFIVFNNVPFGKFDRERKVKKACKELGVKCLDVRFRTLISGAAQICAWGIFWAYHRFFRWEKDTIQVIFDSDMFFINDFNFNEYLGDNDICAIHQRRGHIEYLWNGIVVMRGGNLPDKNHFDYRLGTIDGERTDVGGRLCWWMKRNPQAKIKYISHTGHLDVSKSVILPETIREEYKSEYCFQFIENAVLHYRAGSNWDKKSQNFVDTKKQYLDKLLNELLVNNQKITDSPEYYFCKEKEEPRAESKVEIYTLANMAPDLIYKQYKTIKNFITDKNWELIILNNTPVIAPKRRREIKKICKELGLKCVDVRFRSFISGASYITGWGIHWAYHRYFRWTRNVIHCLIDSDMFFIKNFNFNEYLGNNDICAVHQRRGKVEYLWNGIFFMRGGELPDKQQLDFRLTTVDGDRTDCGGRTYFWLKNHPELKIKYMRHTEHSDVSGTAMLPDSIRGEYKSEYDFQFIEDFVLHSRGGSNWNKDSSEFVNAKIGYLDKFLDEVLNKGAEVKLTEELYVCKQ